MFVAAPPAVDTYGGQYTTIRAPRLRRTLVRNALDLQISGSRCFRKFDESHFLKGCNNYLKVPFIFISFNTKS